MQMAVFVILPEYFGPGSSCSRNCF